MKKQPRSFISHPHGPPKPVDKLRFAVVDKDDRVVSSVWTVFPSHNPHKLDVYVTASGFRGSAKYSFHEDVLNHSFLAEAHAGLLRRGVVPAGSRHQTQLSIPALPWCGLKVRFAPELMRKEGHSADDYNGTIVALPVPRTGHILEIVFILAVGRELHVKGAQFAIGEVGSGGRALAIVGRYIQHDQNAFLEDVRGLVARAQVPPEVAKTFPAEDLAMHVWGVDDGILVVTEVHNLRLAKQH